jgi:hypothetical protein
LNKLPRQTAFFTSFSQAAPGAPRHNFASLAGLLTHARTFSFKSLCQ